MNVTVTSTKWVEWDVKLDPFQAERGYQECSKTAWRHLCRVHVENSRILTHSRPSIVQGIEDYEGGIVVAYGTFSRLHVFKALNHHEVVQNIVQCSTQFLGIEIKVLKSQLTLDHVERERFGKYRYVSSIHCEFGKWLCDWCIDRLWLYSKDQSMTSMSEFTVQKITHRHPEPVRRILCLADATILERDPQTYSVSVWSWPTFSWMFQQIISAGVHPSSTDRNLRLNSWSGKYSNVLHRIQKRPSSIVHYQWPVSLRIIWDKKNQKFNWRFQWFLAGHPIGCSPFMRESGCSRTRDTNAAWQTSRSTEPFSGRRDRG